MKNKIKINKRCNYREWPIRRQLMFSFLCTTILLQFILISVIFGNIEYMITQTDTQIYDKVNDHSNKQFYQISNQAGLNFQAHIYYLSSQLQTIVQTFPQLLNPILAFQKQLSYTNCQTAQQINYYDVCFFIKSNPYNLDANVLELIGYMQNYNQYLPYLFVESYKSQVQLLSILIYNQIQALEVYMIYPSQPINDYYLNKKQFKGYQISGPYLNTLNETQVMMSLQYQTSYNSYRLYFTFEFPITSIKKYFIDLNYYNSTIIVFTDKSGTIMYAPENWNISYQTQIEKIYNYPLLSGFNISRIPIQQNSYIEVQNQSYKLMKLSFSGHYESSQLSSFIDNINTQVDFYVYLYVLEDQLLTTFAFIDGIMQKEETAIIFINVSSTILTISLVFIFTYMIAVRVSRPLNKLVKIAKYMSNNLTKKNISGEILSELKQIEATNQIADILRKFRKLVESIKNQSNSKNSMVKKNVVQYPLNQYDPEFINKTKNKTDVNWGPIINEIDE